MPFYGYINTRVGKRRYKLMKLFTKNGLIKEKIKVPKRRFAKQILLSNSPQNIKYNLNRK